MFFWFCLFVCLFVESVLELLPYYFAVGILSTLIWRRCTHYKINESFKKYFILHETWMGYKQRKRFFLVNCFAFNMFLLFIFS